MSSWRVCVPGAAVGMVLATRVMGAVLAASPVDPITSVSIPLLLLGVATLASYLPAGRSGRMNPLTELRSE